LRQITQLNQVAALAKQLRTDLQLPNHKYMAHQLALLYQSLGMVGPSMAHFKTRIEEMFDQVKAVTNSGPDPQLILEHQHWLYLLCSDLLKEIAELPQGLGGPHIYTFLQEFI
jgi:hypothetical protein